MKMKEMIFMENKIYDIKLNPDTYSVDIPYADHIELLDVIDRAIVEYNTTKNNITENNKKYDYYAEKGEIPKDFAERMKKENEYNLKKIEKRLEVAYTLIDSIKNI
jgi:hypothetical protein